MGNLEKEKDLMTYRQKKELFAGKHLRLDYFSFYESSAIVASEYLKNLRNSQNNLFPK